MERIIKDIETILSIALFLSLFLIISFVVYKCRNSSETSTNSLFYHASPPDPDYENQPIGMIAYFQMHGRFPPPRPAPDPIQPRAWRENELRRHEGPLPAPRSPPPPSSPRVEDYLSSPAEGQYNGLVPRNGPRHIWDLRQNPARRRENPWARPKATNQEVHRPEDGEQQQEQQQQKTTLDSNTTPAGADDSARATETRQPEQRQPARPSPASELNDTEDDFPTTSQSVADASLRSDDLPPTTTPSPDKVADKTTGNPTSSPPVAAAAQTVKMPSMAELYHLPANVLLQMSHPAARDQVGSWLKSVNGTPEQMMALAAEVKLTWLDNVRLIFFFWYQWVCMQGDASWDLQKLDKADIEVAAPVVDNVLASLQAFARQYADNADYLDQITRNVQKVRSGMRCGLQAAYRLEAAVAEINQQRLEQQRLVQQRLEEIRQEQFRLEQQHLEQQQLEQQRFEEHRLQQQRLEQERLEQQRLEAQRLAQQQQFQREQELQRQQEQERRDFRNEAQKQKKQQRDQAESAEPECQRKPLPASEEERAKREEDAMIAEVQEELQGQQNNASQASETQTKQDAGRKRKAAEYTEQQRQHQPSSAPEEQQQPEQKQSEFTPFIPPPTANQRDWVPPYMNASESSKAPLPFKKPPASGSWTPPPALRPAAQYASGSKSTFPPGYQPSGLRLQVPGPPVEDDDDDGYES